MAYMLFDVACSFDCLALHMDSCHVGPIYVRVLHVMSHHAIVASRWNCIHFRIASLGHILDFHVILLCCMLIYVHMVDLHACRCIFHFIFIYVAYVVIYHFLLVHVTLFGLYKCK